MLKNILIKISTWALIGVDLVLNVVTMWIIAPDPISRVGFVGVGIAIVVLCLPSWLRGKKLLWLSFAAVSVFLNLSFTLESIDLQSNAVTVQTDTQIARLDQRIDSLDAQLVKYDEEYSKARQRATMDDIERNRGIVRTELAKAESQRDIRIKQIESGEVSLQIAGNDIFSAIPRAVADFRVIQLIVFTLIFSAMQYAIVVFATDEKSAQTTPPARPTRPRKTKPAVDHVSRWVSACWVGIENGRKDIISRSSFEEFYRTRGGFPAERYDAIKQAAQDANVIDPAGEILIKDKREAVNIIKATLDS